jgi:hypothetical protein
MGLLKRIRCWLPTAVCVLGAVFGVFFAGSLGILAIGYRLTQEQPFYAKAVESVRSSSTVQDHCGALQSVNLLFWGGWDQNIHGREGSGYLRFRVNGSEGSGTALVYLLCPTECGKWMMWNSPLLGLSEKG